MRTQTAVSGHSGRDNPVIRRILVPLTLGEGTREVLRLASILAARHHAELVLLHVVQMDVPGEPSDIPEGRLRKLLCDAAQSELKELVQMLNLKLPVKVIVRAGLPSKAIEETLNAVKADLLISCAETARSMCQTEASCKRRKIFPKKYVAEDPD
ncbi:MAG: universal stress protein [Verrucomicrobiota bacterium]